MVENKPFQKADKQITENSSRRKNCENKQNIDISRAQPWPWPWDSVAPRQLASAGPGQAFSSIRGIPAGREFDSPGGA
jgi:hypothetical protein